MNDSLKHLRAAQDERDTINEQAEELSVQNDELEARLAEAEKVNKRLKEGDVVTVACAWRPWTSLTRTTGAHRVRVA